MFMKPSSVRPPNIASRTSQEHRRRLRCRTSGTCSRTTSPAIRCTLIATSGNFIVILRSGRSAPIEQDHGWLFPERAPSSWPHGFSRLPAPVPPFMLFEPMVMRPRTIIHQFSSSPMFPGQFNTQSSTGLPNSRLTADEQAAVLKKLRKDTYNPSPRRFLRMVGMYYHDQNSARTRFDPRDDDEDSKRCTVCLEDFESGEEVTITPCDHMFHENCIVPWVKDHGRCPICRFSLHEREIPRTQASRAPETVYRQ